MRNCMNKIIFFSESNIQGKVPRDFENARTEFGWSIMLDAEWCPIKAVPPHKDYDLGVVIIPKNNPEIDLSRFKNYCKNVSVMQEGPHWYYQDYSVDKQIHYVNTLRSADWVYCHNKSDRKYYKGLGCRDVRVMRSMMIPDGLDSQVGSPYKDGILLGGNFVSWYGGMDSYLVASEVDDQKYGVSMGRKQEQEEMIEDIKYLPYMNWREWIYKLAEFKYAVHLMPTIAAGTFAMNCAYLGIPCVGYKDADTQSKLHPQLGVSIGDIESARKLCNKLKNDTAFYEHQSEVCKNNYHAYHSEEQFVKDMKKLKEVLNG